MLPQSAICGYMASWFSARAKQAQDADRAVLTQVAGPPHGTCMPATQQSPQQNLWQNFRRLLSAGTLHTTNNTRTIPQGARLASSHHPCSALPSPHPVTRLPALCLRGGRKAPGNCAQLRTTSSSPGATGPPPAGVASQVRPARHSALHALTQRPAQACTTGPGRRNCV